MEENDQFERTRCEERKKLLAQHKIRKYEFVKKVIDEYKIEEGLALLLWAECNRALGVGFHQGYSFCYWDYKLEKMDEKTRCKS